MAQGPTGRETNLPSYIHELGHQYGFTPDAGWCLRVAEQIDRLSQAEGIRNDPVAQALLRTLAIVCQIATNQATEACLAFASLVALVERQPDDFHLVCNWIASTFRGLAIRRIAKVLSFCEKIMETSRFGR